MATEEKRIYLFAEGKVSATRQQGGRSAAPPAYEPRSAAWPLDRLLGVGRA